MAGLLADGRTIGKCQQQCLCCCCCKMDPQTLIVGFSFLSPNCTWRSHQLQTTIQTTDSIEGVEWSSSKLHSCVYTLFGRASVRRHRDSCIVRSTHWPRTVHDWTIWYIIRKWFRQNYSWIWNIRYLTSNDTVLQGYYGCATGKAKQAAKTEIEKLKLQDMDIEQLITEAGKMYVFTNLGLKFESYQISTN